MGDEDRIIREKEFYNREAVENRRASVSKFYSITRASRKYYEGILKANCLNKRVLDYGCGVGTFTIWLAKQGAIVTGIDISDARIELAKRRAIEEGVSNATFIVMDAENLEFDDDYFDIVCGGAILHHLNLSKALSEIARVLKPGKMAVFIEPLGHNPIINLYRRLTPSLRTRDEHPLVMKDLKLMRRYFGNVEVKYFHLFSLLAVPFRNSPIFQPLLNLTESIDRALLQISILQIQAWQAVIVLSQPRKRE